MLEEVDEEESFKNWAKCVKNKEQWDKIVNDFFGSHELNNGMMHAFVKNLSYGFLWCLDKFFHKS